MLNIILDSGHGGDDPGAINKNLNVKEKELNLVITKKVYDILKEYNCKPIMTRTSDETLSLSKRVSVSNNNNGKRFISIHCNSYKTHTPQGYEVWVYSKKDNENLGSDILNSLSNNINGVNRGLKENKEYYVTRYTSCKACIVEVGFISNVDECKQIINMSDKYARAIADGIIKNLKLKKKECECTCHK